MYKKLLVEKGKSLGFVSLLSSIKKENRMWKFICFIAFVVILILAIGAPMNSIDPITTKNISYISKDIIAEVRIEGGIMPDVEREKMFEEIYKSNKIKGMVIVINSPGGAAGASELLYWQIKKIGSKMPVAVFVEDLAASGGYMAAIAGHKIFAMRTSVVGSIGIRGFAKFDLTGFIKKYDISYEEYASSEYKTAGSNFQKTTEKERVYMQETLMQGYVVFKSMVAEERKLEGKQLEQVANAKVFFGDKALEYKLIDEIGTKDLAIEFINSKLEVKPKKPLQVKMIRPEPKKVDGLFGNVSQALLNIFGFFERKTQSENRAMAEL